MNEHTLFDYPNPLTPGDTPLAEHTDSQLAEMIREWKHLTTEE